LCLFRVFLLSLFGFLFSSFFLSFIAIIISE
jgi:hypothetical protein